LFVCFAHSQACLEGIKSKDKIFHQILTHLKNKSQDSQVGYAPDFHSKKLWFSSRPGYNLPKKIKTTQFALSDHKSQGVL